LNSINEALNSINEYLNPINEYLNSITSFRSQDYLSLPLRSSLRDATRMRPSLTRRYANAVACGKPLRVYIQKKF
jgi:hypothetical protein